LWDISGPITEHFQFFQKNFFESNFCSPFFKDSIKGSTKNVKISYKSSQNQFLDDIFAENPGTK
jgi:hypothetical protein